MRKMMKRAIVPVAALAAVAILWQAPPARGQETADSKEAQMAADAKRARAAKMAMDRNPADKPAMLAALADPDPLVRRHAIYGLERLGEPASAKDLLPLLKDSDPWVRRNAAIALGKLRSAEAVKPLLDALADADVRLRLEAFVALGRIGDPASQKPIIEAMRDKRLWTELGAWDQVAILHVVDRRFFTDREVVPVLKWLLTYQEWDHPEFAELSAERKAQFSLLISNAAATVLATKFADAAGEEWLLKGLAADDYMQQTSAAALGKLKSKKAVPGLVKMLDGEWMTNRRYAIQALAEIAEAESVPALEKLLAHADARIRGLAAEALEKIDGKKRPVDLSDPAAKIPEIAEADLKTPGGKRPPQFICLGVDDCVNIEGLESMLDICETLRDRGAKAVFTMWVAPLASDWKNRDMEKQTMLLQRLFDLGCEIAHHTLHHNPGGKNWASLPREIQVEEIEGCTQWYRDNIRGFTRPFTHKGGGGGTGARIDPEFTRDLLARQKFLYWGRRGRHPDEQMWPPAKADVYMLDAGCLDAAAPPVHAAITDPIHSDYSGRFDYETPAGVAMWKANFEYHYNHPRRPILAVNAFHDWGFKTLDDSTTKRSHRNEAAILKEFLLDVLVKNKEKFPETHCVTFRQVIEYAATEGDLSHTLAAGNCQDSRNPVKPRIE